MFRQLLTISALLGVLAGCTKGSEGPENSLQIPLASNLKSLDPAQSSDAYTDDVIPNIYEGLLQYQYLKRPLTVEPLLASDGPTASKDGLTHTFKIRPGVKFHDSEVFKEGKGREITAEDFIYSWKRLADPKTQSDGWWIFDGKIKGLNEWRDKLEKGAADYSTPIEGLQAPDPHTLVIKLTEPYYQLYYVLTMSYASVVPKEAVDKYGPEFINHPVGTGPYVFESWIRGNKVILTKNPNWHGGTYPSEGEAADKDKGLLADAGKPLPFADKLVFHEIPEDQPRWLNMMKGAIDLVAIPKDNFDAAVENGKLKDPLVQKGIGLTIFPNSDIAYIAFNMEDPLVGKNVHLRRALSLAYNTKVAATKFYNNRIVPGYSIIAPGLDGYDPGFKTQWRDYDVEKAKAELKKAGYPDGKGLPVIEYNTAASTTGRQMSEFLEQQWAQIGVKTNLVMNSWPQFQDRVRNKKAQTFGMAWNADYPDSQNMFQLLYSKNVSPGPNNTNYSNKAFDELYVKALKTPPGSERTKLYQKMRDIMVEDMPMIVTGHRLGYTVYHGWLKNLKRDMMMRGYYKYLRVDVDKKKELKAKF
jgi:ABC-type transport system substrate-binding protein